MDMLISLIVIIISQGVHISKHHVAVCPNDMVCLYDFLILEHLCITSLTITKSRQIVILLQLLNSLY